jgi:hypothetical protein
VSGEAENLKNGILLPGGAKKGGGIYGPQQDIILTIVHKLWPYWVIKTQIDMIARINMGEFSWLEN